MTASVGPDFLQFNQEIRFPLYKKLGLTGTVFFDAGNVYGPNYVGPFLRTSVGVGFRWFSPMGPLRVEWGYNLSKNSWNGPVPGNSPWAGHSNLMGPRQDFSGDG